MRTLRDPAKPKETEATLCADFNAFAAGYGWTAYAETGGWDIVLVRDGIQIGVQAKLRFNATLLRQALPSHWCGDWPGPEYRAVLIPKIDKEIREVCQFCGLICFNRYDGWLPRAGHDRRPFEQARGFAPAIDPGDWQVWSAKEPVKLPEYVPDIPAGASSPVQLTDWKVGALRICAILEVRGYVTTADFKRFRIDHRRWTLSVMGWLLPAHLQKGRYVRGPKLNFDKQHPVVYQQILAEMRKRESKLESNEAKTGK